jgi:hypothetical protein
MYWLASLLTGDLRQPSCIAKGLAIVGSNRLLLLISNVAIRAFDPIFALQCYERVAKLDPEYPIWMR